MHKKLMPGKIIILLLSFVFILRVNAQQVSVSLGMGASYSDNPTLKTYVGYEIPYYPNLPEKDKLSNFSAGFDFFGGAEIHIKKNFSVKGEYSYFTKSLNANNVAGYDFSYESHQPYIDFLYVIPQKYSVIKLGAGAGCIFSNFTNKYYSIENNYTSTGFGLKLNAIVNMSVGKNFSVYLEGNMGKTFHPALKDSGGNVLKDKNGGEVNLSSFGIALRLGVEFFVFK
jgi:hypothetical protein